MKISVIGLGWYGAPLAKALQDEGHSLLGTTRTDEKRDQFLKLGIEAYKLDASLIPPPELMNVDVIVLNIPPFAGQLEWFKQWGWQKNTWLIFVSSTSVYPVAQSEMARLLLLEESWVKTFPKHTILRMGGLIGAGRHPGRSLSGKTQLAGPRRPVNLIHQKDAVKFTLEVIRQELTSKTFHVVSSEHPERETFYQDFCRKHHLPLPEFDQNDQSSGHIVPNDEMRKYYSHFHKLTD